MLTVNIPDKLKTNTSKEFIKFCIVGAICTAVDYIVYITASMILKYQTAVILGFIISFGVNYFLTALWTFQVNPTKNKFVGMVTCHLINLFVVRIGLLTLFIEIFLLDKNIAYLPVLVISALTSFIMMKFVFKTKKHLPTTSLSNKIPNHITMPKKIIYIILSLLACGIFFLLDEIFYEPVSDELLYRFKLGEHPLGEEDYSEHIASLHDVFVSQFHQYFHSNGRYIVHVFVQAFAGLMPRIVFDVVNTIVLLGTIIMLMKFSIRKRTNFTSPILWIFAIIAYFYAFPGSSSLFISIPGALNYLWPMAITLIYIYIYIYINGLRKASLVSQDFSNYLY